ncbi:hypothetical protein [Streptomyces luteogriseus]|uniref:hypothetical protein n=1 Tax=Streptomyces luteogriseus TaxID=68233 RepID=UPI003793BE6D
MVRALVDFCDNCEEIGLDGIPAERSITIAIDGPPKRFELCTIHLHQLKPLWELYNNRGVDESFKPKRRGSNRQNTDEAELSVKLAQQELPSAEPAEPAPAPTSKKGKGEERIRVTCSLPHDNGQDATVQYRSRASHAKEAHNGSKTWDIEWGDPSGSLTHPCTTHAQCMKVNLAFPSETSLSRHIRMCPLEKLPEAA